MSDNKPDPVAMYVSVYQRLLAYEQMDEKMPPAEAVQAFHDLMVSCDALIRENEALRRAVAISEGVVTDLEIELCVKEIELFNFTNQSEEKDKENP